MINLFENFDTDSIDFLRSQKIAGFKIPSVVINDDGFLPNEVDSPIKYYCHFSQQKMPLYFDQLPLPRFWRIEATSRSANVFDLDRKRAEINFTETGDNSRLIKQVQWFDRDQQVRWIDHYNQNGWRFAQTYYDKGKAVLRKYYNQQGQEIIVRHLVAGDIYLHIGHTYRHFINLVDFILDFLNKRHYKLNHIFYNTLNIPFFLDLKLSLPGEDTLFWHEPTANSLPGNMQYLLQTKTRTRHIVFQRYRDWVNHQNLLKDNKNTDFRYLGMIYPHPRSNKLRLNALILTNSDQIEHLDQVVQNLSQVHFNIAALTEMSEKLLAYDKYPNVDLYPNINLKKVKELFGACDLYFDINHYAEILHAVRNAFEQNMLIVGFNNTLHNQQFIAPGNIFAPTEVDKMAAKVMAAADNVNIMQEQLDLQRQLAGDESVADYQKVIGELINEPKEQRK